MNVPCPYFSYTNEEAFQAVNAFELGSRAMVGIETQTGGIVYIVWFWAGWMFWRFLLNLKGQCTKHREFPPSLSPCWFCRHDKIMSAASRNWRNLVMYGNTMCYLQSSWNVLWKAWSRAWGLIHVWNCLSRCSNARRKVERSKNFNIELREVIFGCCVTNTYDARRWHDVNGCWYISLLCEN